MLPARRSELCPSVAACSSGTSTLRGGATTAMADGYTVALSSFVATLDAIVRAVCAGKMHHPVPLVLGAELALPAMHTTIHAKERAS